MKTKPHRANAATPVCNKCGVELNEGNWYPSQRKGNEHICNKCDVKRVGQWRHVNPAVPTSGVPGDGKPEE